MAAKQKPRKLSRFHPKRITFGRFFGLLLLTMLVWRIFHPIPVPRDFSFDPKELHTVVRVIDGDTIQLHDQRVRFIGVDTPELKGPNGQPENFANEATDALRSWIGQQPVRLEFDRERIDKYQRLLAYVYVGDEMLNERLIRSGYSRAETQYGYSTLKKKLFVAAEDEARGKKTGLWSDPAFFARNTSTKRR